MVRISADADALVAASRVVALIGDDVAAATRGAPLGGRGRFGGAGLVSAADRFARVWSGPSGLPRLGGDLQGLSAGLAGTADDCVRLEEEFSGLIDRAGCDTAIRQG